MRTKNDYSLKTHLGLNRLRRLYTMHHHTIPSTIYFTPSSNLFFVSPRIIFAFSLSLSLSFDVIVCHFRKDARLPVQLQRAMAAEAEAAREARAKVRAPPRDIQV